MTTKQENFIRMVRAVNKVLTENQQRWLSLKRFEQSATELKDLISLIDTVGTKANSPIKGATIDKHTIEEDAIDEGLKIASCASVYADDKRNMELHDKLQISRSTLLRMHEDECLKRLKDVHRQLEPIVGELEDYGILKADLSYFETLIVAYENALAKPRQLTAERKTMNEDLQPDLIRKMRKSLEAMDRMINRFDGTPFPMDYKNARVVIELGSRSEADKPDDEKQAKTENLSLK